MKKFILKSFIVLAWVTQAKAGPLTVDCGQELLNTTQACYFIDVDSGAESVTPWIITDESVQLPTGDSLFHDFTETYDYEKDLLDLLEAPDQFGVNKEILLRATWTEHEGGTVEK